LISVKQFEAKNMYRLSAKGPITRKIKRDVVLAIVKTPRLLFGTCFENMIDGMPTKAVSGCAI